MNPLTLVMWPHIMAAYLTVAMVEYWRSHPVTYWTTQLPLL